MRKLTVGDLFSGIGGFSLGLERTGGFETKWFVEIDPFCNKVLAKHWPNIRRYQDVREVHGIIAHTKYDGLYGSEVGRSIKKTSNHNTEGENKSSESSGSDRPKIGRNIPSKQKGCPSCLEPVDLVCGGFPCQPFSVAGKRKGKEDDRALWPEMFRIIQELKPSWVLGENVAGIINMELENCFSDLEMAGYEVQALVIPACAVQAPHRRDRVWIVAHNTQNTLGGRNGRWSNGDSGRGKCLLQTERPDCHAPDTGCFGQEKREQQTTRSEQYIGWDEPWIETAARLCRVDARISNRVDRLKCLGNSVVPQIVSIIGKAILCFA